MSVIKSFLDGVGSGAGVAWPLFGILTSSVGLAAGSAWVIAAGSVSGLLFCGISAAIFYFSYTSACNKNKSLLNKVEMAQRSFERVFSSYLLGIINDCECASVIDNKKEHVVNYILKTLRSDFSNHKSSLVQVLLKQLEKKEVICLLGQFVLQKKHALGINNDFLLLMRLFTQAICQEMSKRRLGFFSLFQPGFIGAVGAFGAIAGCSAGFVGMLSGVGIFGGFAAFPLLGCATLVFALGIAITVGLDSVKRAEHRHEQKERKHMFQSLVSDLDALRINKKIDINLPSPPSDQEINQPVIQQEQFSRKNHTHSFFRGYTERLSHEQDALIHGSGSCSI